MKLVSAMNWAIGVGDRLNYWTKINCRGAMINQATVDSLHVLFQFT